MKCTPEKTFKSLTIMTPCAHSTANPLSSQTVDERESAFSFSLSDKRGLLKAGVGISSTEVIGETVLAISIPKTMGVMETVGVTEGPFPVTHTVLFSMLDNGSSFFDLIFAYKSLLNVVVFSTKRKKLKKKKKKKKPKYIQENQY